MKNFIGHKIQVMTRSSGILSGVLVSEEPILIHLRGVDDVITRIFKQDIGGFKPLDGFEPTTAPVTTLPPVSTTPVTSESKQNCFFNVMCCFNQTIGCKGVQYVKEGQGISKNDIEHFVGGCGSRCSSCKICSIGDLRKIDEEILRTMVSDTIFGEFPKTKEKKSNEQRSK